MKKLYIKPQTEVVTNDYLCEPDAPLHPEFSKVFITAVENSIVKE